MAINNTPNKVYILKVLKIYGFVKNTRVIFVYQMKSVWLDRTINTLMLKSSWSETFIYFYKPMQNLSSPNHQSLIFIFQSVTLGIKVSNIFWFCSYVENKNRHGKQLFVTCKIRLPSMHFPCNMCSYARQKYMHWNGLWYIKHEFKLFFYIFWTL